MSKKKFVFVAMLMVLLGFGLMVGGWFAYDKLANKPKSSTKSAPSTPDTIGNLSPSTLSVGDASSDKTGQLLPQAELKASESRTSGSASGIDPTTFKQYEKYVTAEAGLFGEIQAGNGAELTVGKKATITYKGWLTSGQLFDQSAADKDGKLQPLVFTLGNKEVIAGMEQGILGMKAGGRRLVIVPPSAGYGKQGQGPIPPNAVLVFDVTLHKVE